MNLAPGQPEDRQAHDGQDEVLHRDELGRLEDRIAAQMLEQRCAEQGVGAPEHRRECDEQDREAFDHAVSMAWRGRPTARPRACLDM